MASITTTGALHMLKHNGIIAHQTDTVFGLACLPKEKLLQRMSAIKHRDQKQGFILLASNVTQLADFIDCNEQELIKLGSSQTKPTTWLVNASKLLSPSLVGDTHKVAVRITSYENIKALCEILGPIASTSANISNQKTCRNAKEVRDVFGTLIDYIEPKSLPGTGQASAIIDLQSGKVIRN